MNNCNTSPLFVPTTVIANVKNIDAVDVAATNISCDTLSIGGQPFTNVLQNITSAGTGTTVFSGSVTAGSLVSNGSTTTSTLTSGTTSAGTLSATSISNTGSLTVSGASALQGVTATSLTSTGDLIVDTNVLKVDTGNNKVGINVTTPSEALDVSGNAKVSGNLTVDTTTLVVNASSNRVGVNTAVPTEALDVTGNIKGSGTLAITGNGTVGGTLGVTGNTTLTGDLTVDTNVLRVVTSSNMVGINTLVPTEALDVTGNIKGSGSLAITGNTTVGGALGVTGALTAGYFLPYTFSTVSANSGSLNIVIPTDTSATRIELFLYSLGIASNSFFVFRIGTDTSTFLTSTIYDYHTFNIAFSTPFTESGDSKTAIRCCNNLDNLEKVTGRISLIKQAAAHGASAGWYVDGNLRSSTTGQQIITGFIRHTGSIGAVRFESALGNFNVGNSYIRSASTREF